MLTYETTLSTEVADQLVQSIGLDFKPTNCILSFEPAFDDDYLYPAILNAVLYNADGLGVNIDDADNLSTIDFLVVQDVKEVEDELYSRCKQELARQEASNLEDKAISLYEDRQERARLDTLNY